MVMEAMVRIPGKKSQFPADDGLFLINLETGSSKLLVSYEQMKDLVPPTRGREHRLDQSCPIQQERDQKYFGYAGREINEWMANHRIYCKQGWYQSAAVFS